MSELASTGAITEQYLAEAAVLKPLQEDRTVDRATRIRLQDAGLKALIKNQEVVS